MGGRWPILFFTLGEHPPWLPKLDRQRLRLSARAGLRSFS
jgi:hypothetical protein